MVTLPVNAIVAKLRAAGATSLTFTPQMGHGLEHFDTFAIGKLGANPANGEGSVA
jgi:hypothetical protein